jgi:hypothetical protein
MNQSHSDQHNAVPIIADNNIVREVGRGVQPVKSLLI